MSKIDSSFPHDIFKFLHRPLREIDTAQGKEFLERFLLGPQSIFEDTQAKIDTLIQLIDPAKTRADLLQFLKDHVGFTVELNNITNGLATNDLRKLISLGVALWKQKGTEQGYENIVRLFTGKSIRIFNYFDFRLIVGEKAFGEEQLGEDAWLISLPGFDATSDASNNVVDLLPFESNFKDRSNSRNNATIHGVSNFFNTPASGFPALSDKYLNLDGGVVTQPNSDVYDFSGDFTIELFIRTSISQAGRFLFFKKDGAGQGIELSFDSSSNTVAFDLDDGAINISGSITPGANLDDGTVRHIALVIDRANGVRLYINGTESTSLIALGALSDLTNSAQIIVGGDGVISNNYLGDLDNFRIALNDVYDVTSGTLTPPLSGFIEFREEELDEFFSDIRVPVEDPANFDKILMLRILNLMRPSSERLRTIFITFFDDFVLGGGRFETLLGISSINFESELELAPDTIVQTDVINDSKFKDIVLQVKAIIIAGTGSVLFFIQDIDNFYEFRADVVTKKLSLHKTIGGVSSQIGSDVTVDIVDGIDYIFTITTDFNAGGPDTLLQTFFDSNLIHQVVDATFEKGKFGMKTAASTTMKVGEVEMFQRPLDVRLIEPGFDL